MTDVANRLGLAGRLDDGALIEFVKESRWFGSRSQDIASIDLVDAIALPESATWIVLIELTYETGTHEVYQLVLAAQPNEVELQNAIAVLDGHTLYEASADPILARTVADPPGGGLTVEGESGTVEIRAFGNRYAGLGTADVRPVGADQSNTSLVVGDTLLAKLYRRVGPGLHPELEMLLYLTEQGFANVAPATGWYGYTGPQLRATLGVVQEFLPNAVDGWGRARRELHERPVDFVASVRELGGVVGEMHAVLARDADDPAFAPEEPTTETAGLLTATLEDEIDAVCAVARDHENREADTVGSRVEDFRRLARQLMPPAVGGRLIRTHGDLHLGQVLWADGDWFVTDFEGEPARSVTERRRKMIPLRDVAGMMRSFAYVAATLTREGHDVGDFEERARSEFLAGYRDRVDLNVLPTATEAQDRLLEFFELEKLVYELRYEIEHRPEWAYVPLSGLQRMIDRVDA